jgi:hypothetical protein
VLLLASYVPSDALGRARLQCCLLGKISVPLLLHPVIYEKGSRNKYKGGRYGRCKYLRSVCIIALLEDSARINMLTKAKHQGKMCLINHSWQGEGRSDLTYHGIATMTFGVQETRMSVQIERYGNLHVRNFSSKISSATKKKASLPTTLYLFWQGGPQRSVRFW